MRRILGLSQIGGKPLKPKGVKLLPGFVTNLSDDNGISHLVQACNAALEGKRQRPLANALEVALHSTWYWPDPLFPLCSQARPQVANKQVQRWV